MKTYQMLAKACGAYHRCVQSNNTEWQAKWKEQIKEAMEDFPHGSGFDNGTKIDLDKSNDDRLVFTTAFHHMNEAGMYDGWTEHTITVVPSLGLDFHLKISGRDRNQIKEYIAEMFQSCLNEDTEANSTGKTPATA